MASVSSLSGSSSSSSIYGNRTYNIISGLASGLDTEQLISGVVQSYQQKIQSLNQENTKLQWQQQAYQSVSDKLVEFYRNYSSYVYSNTNLSSSSFFNKAVTTTANGTYGNLVSASGKTSSTVVLNAVKQLATAARYTTSAQNLKENITSGTNPATGAATLTVTGEGMANLAGDMDLSKLSGSLTLNYGDRTVSIDLGERELFVKDGKLDSAGLQSAIEEKLKGQQISTSSGSVVKADTLIGVSVSDDGTVSFYDKSKAGNTVSIASASGNLATNITGLSDVISNKAATFKLTQETVDNPVEQKATAEYLAGKSITVSLDGQSKTFELPKINVTAGDNAQTAKDFKEALQKTLDKQFGANKVTVDVTADNKLAFTVDKGSTLSVTASNSDVADVLGIDTGLTTYLDTTQTLGDLKIDWDKMVSHDTLGSGGVTEKKDEDGNVITGEYVDSAGNAVDKDGYLIDENKKRIQSYDLIINEVKIGSFTKDTEINTVINKINSNTEAGVNVNYSKTTGQFVFTAKDTGSGGRVDISGTDAADSSKSTLGAQLFGATVDEKGAQIQGIQYEDGKDAKFIATINGQAMEFTRASNSFDLDGMQVTVSGTFNSAAVVKGNNVVIEQKDPNDPNKTEDIPVTDTVTFTSKTNADTIVDAVKKMVEDLNAIIKEVKSAYSDMPLQKSDGSKYEPLTDEDMEGMSDSAIENYEEKAKTGILFMDSDLSSLYNDLRNAITSSGADGVTLRSMGIETSYSSGLTTLTFDEQKFREALESDPDKVQEAFTKSKENGAATNGLMATLTAITDKYADTDGDVKGILIEKAGSKYSPTAALDNDMLDQMKDVEDEIAKWQDKMSNKVDYYTNKFTQLELLINQMNSQSSALSGLMGG